MKTPTYKLSDQEEIERLQRLLAPELRSQIEIVAAKQHQALIKTRRLNQQRSIQIDFSQWCAFATHQRDLLFWHEIARIQNRAIAPAWEITAISIGISAALMELISHSLLAFTVALGVTGMAAYKLYQRKLGEQSFREATAADQTAIELAMQAGYSFTEAYDSLYEALQRLTLVHKSRWNNYQVRIRVLEMLNTSKHSQMQTFNFDVVSPYSPLNLNL